MGEPAPPYRVETHTATDGYHWRYRHYPVPADAAGPRVDVDLRPHPRELAAHAGVIPLWPQRPSVREQLLDVRRAHDTHQPSLRIGQPTPVVGKDR